MLWEPASVRARDVFLGPEKLRALWRVLIFFVCAILAFWLLSVIVQPLAPLGRDAFWSIAIGGGVMMTAALITSAIMMRWSERRPLAALGLPLGKQLARELLMGATIGGCFIAAVVVMHTLVGWLRPAPDAGTLLDWLTYQARLAMVLAIAATAEELLFRGYPFQVLVEGIGAPLAVIISSAAFAAVHAFNPGADLLSLLNIGLAGVLLAGAYLRTRSLWVAIGLHWGWNWVMAGVFDMPVSGIEEFDAPGYDTLERGPDLFTGGAFGPEGGLTATLLSLPFIVWVFRTGWLQESPRMAALRPLIDARGLR